MTVVAFDKWIVDDPKVNPMWETIDHAYWKPGPKNVSWIASCVCNPPQFVGDKGMFATYKNWITAREFTAQYEHSLCVWYFEREDEAILFDFTFN